MLGVPLKYWMILCQIDLTGLGTLSILGWSKPNVLPNELNTAVSTTVYGVGAATTIAVTTLAAARLLLVRRYHIELMGMYFYFYFKYIISFLTSRRFTREI